MSALPSSSHSPSLNTNGFSFISTVCLFAIFICTPNLAHSQCAKPPIIFNFGDSNSDTGGIASGLGFSIRLPNGRAFFRRSTGRLCDGRLLIDFLSQSTNTTLLRPYLDSLGSSTFANGANFAIAGSATLPKFVPFALNIQVMQFKHFKERSTELAAAGMNILTSSNGFSDALYMIDIGQNDIADSFSKGLSYPQVVKKIPSMLAEIKNAIVELYNEGGRKFWVHNTGPVGCLPQKLSLVKNTSNDLDSFGCISSYNQVAKLFNEGLRVMCSRLRSEVKGASIVYVDMYAIKIDIIANATKYGLSNPLMACCGAGGPPYNYDRRVTCGYPGFKVCDEASRHVSWDGVHYTEAANSVMASKLLSMAYSTPSVPFNFFCQ